MTTTAPVLQGPSAVAVIPGPIVRGQVHPVLALLGADIGWVLRLAAIPAAPLWLFGHGFAMGLSRTATSLVGFVVVSALWFALSGLS